MSRISIYKHNSFTTRKKDRYPVTRCGIILIEQGKLTYLTHNNEQRQLTQGQFTIFHSDEFREMKSYEEDNGFSATLITIEPSLLQQFSPQLEQSETAEESQFTPLSAINNLSHSILSLLIDATAKQTSDNTLESLAIALITEIIAVSPCHLPVLERACNQSTTQKVIRFIELNIENEVSLENTSRFLGISTATLKRRLAAEGLSFSQILKVKRVNYAANKLRLTNKSIAQIAFESGFKSAAHFSTAFKGVQGITPKEFRQRIAENR